MGLFVKKVFIKYRGTSFVPQDIANKEPEIVLDWIEFLLFNSLHIEAVRVEMSY